VVSKVRALGMQVVDGRQVGWLGDAAVDDENGVAVAVQTIDGCATDETRPAQDDEAHASSQATSLY